jgi:hypothetical protein
MGSGIQLYPGKKIAMIRQAANPAVAADVI